MSKRRRGRSNLAGAPLAKLTQELLGRQEKWILKENAPDDDHRVRPHDVNHCFSSKFRKYVHTDDRIVVATPHIVNAGFKLNEIVHVYTAFGRPVHAANDATARKFSFGVAAGQLLERLQHPILIEQSVPKIRVTVDPK